ncbi:unnamed protein product, partial [Mesorhabditis belari]|uniref:Uncharacterized protein n=1 Tax=Mesorhabditis belari TaxID=2138241 RepID=A0AAF3EMW6_9BILA
MRFFFILTILIVFCYCESEEKNDSTALTNSEQNLVRTKREDIFANNSIVQALRKAFKDPKEVKKEKQRHRAHIRKVLRDRRLKRIRQARQQRKARKLAKRRNKVRRAHQKFVRKNRNLLRGFKAGKTF